MSDPVYMPMLCYGTPKLPVLHAWAHPSPVLMLSPIPYPQWQTATYKADGKLQNSFGTPYIELCTASNGAGWVRVDGNSEAYPGAAVFILRMFYTGAGQIRFDRISSDDQNSAVIDLSEFKHTNYHAVLTDTNTTATLNVPYYRYRIQMIIYVWGVSYITVEMHLI